MNNYKRIDEKSMRVMGIKSLIFSVSFITAALIFLIIEVLWLDFFSFPVIFWIVFSVCILGILNFIINGVVIPRYRFKNFKYQLIDDELKIQSGLWFITTQSIPLFRIQNVDTYDGIIMRKYHLANIILSTAGGNAQIMLITKDQAELLKQHIKAPMK